MDVQAAPPTYTPAGGAQPPSGNPPVLGQQIPGRSGGLPAQGGLSVLQNPLAQELQSQGQTNNVNPNTMPNQAAPNDRVYPSAPQFAAGGTVNKAEQIRQMGRGEDSVLMHVTPHELQGLQALAMAHGGSLTVNPHTGLPEAGLLGKLLPALIGVGLNFILPGSGLAIKGLSTAAQAGLMTGAGATALTGSLSKGLMAGLGAFGGASLAGGVQGAVSGVPTPTAPGVAPVGTSARMVDVGKTVASAAGEAGKTVLPETVKTGLPGFMQGFANTAKGSATGLLGKAAVPLAATGLMNSLSASPGGVRTSTGMIDNAYQGPYRYAPQEVTYKSQSPITSRDSSEHLYFANSQPELFNLSGQLVQPGSNTAPGTPILQNYLLPTSKKTKPGTPMYGQRYVPYMEDPMATQMANPLGYADGGEVQLSDGAFVVDARTVSELGNGSSGAGQDLLARMGGRPVRGPGDGVSDSVPARIGRDQPARVARDEVIFSPEAVTKVGAGNQKKGAQKLYALMDKAHKARKKSERGKDTKLRKGLA